ncbi:MAG: hypothetical protein IPK17_26940 [Chloroflexi bacterium]|uniref:hypothetical protein n=1 Tax=Candidatus Flexifilum breve TaxID=3140694 RepID=UPI003135F27F|nr:hypothetical protein [Chloroflexota bacterium]
MFGLVLLIRELRSAGRKVTRSYGLLNLGVSALIALGLVVTPTILTLIPNATVSVATAAADGFPAFGQGRGAAGSTDAAAADVIDQAHRCGERVPGSASGLCSAGGV